MTSPLRPLALATLLLALGAGSGCAHDLPGWKIAKTEHFRVYTDQSPHVFETVLERLEEVHAALTAVLFEVPIPPTEVFLFERGEFQTLLGPVGGMAISNVGRRGILVLYDGWEPQFLQQTAAHELTHAFIDATFIAPPVWFHEGFATFVESIMIQDRAVFLGSHDVGPAADAAHNRFVSVNELFTAHHKQFHGEWEHRHYNTAWAVIHYIWIGENRRLFRRFDAFGAALSGERGRPGGSQRAWQRVFPDIPLDSLDGRLRDHMRETFEARKNSVVGFPFRRPSPPSVQLEPADMTYVDQVRAQLKRHRRADKL